MTVANSKLLRWSHAIVNWSVLVVSEGSLLAKDCAADNGRDANA